MAQASMQLRLKLQTSSINATVLTLVATVGALVVGLGFISNGQEQVLIATTTPAIGLGYAISNAIHSNLISPTALAAAIIALAVQIGADLIAFLPSWNTTVQLVIPVVSAVVLLILQVVHALLSRQAS